MHTLPKCTFFQNFHYGPKGVHLERVDCNNYWADDSWADVPRYEYLIGRRMFRIVTGLEEVKDRDSAFESEDQGIEDWGIGVFKVFDTTGVVVSEGKGGIFKLCFISMGISRVKRSFFSYFVLNFFSYLFNNL